MESVIYKERETIKTYKLSNGNVLKVKLRFDDSCNNKHNTFSITGEFWESAKYLAKNNENGL
ncbi:MAG: hypothetical protein ACRCVT_07745, partial [Leadbetterella sp.]